MRRQALVFLAGILLTARSVAAPVPEETARRVAVNWYHHHAPAEIAAAEIAVSQLQTLTTGQAADCYIYAFRPSGFVIVSGDDATVPVIGYSHVAPVQADLTHPAVREYFDNIQAQLQWVRREHVDNAATLPLWREILEERLPVSAAERDIAPLLTTTWNQGCGYNTDCPADDSGPCDYVWAGCVATAMGQVMKYWAYPPVGNGSHGYTHHQYGYQFADFGATTYDWAGMPEDYGEEDIAQLLYHCGVALEMNYSPSGSGAWVCHQTPNVVTTLQSYFNYHYEIDCVWKSDYNADDWHGILREQLDAGRPMVYRGQGTGGHAFVCDGYQGSDYFHFNWGWSGSYDGYFYCDDLTPGGADFTIFQAAVINIHPYVFPPSINVTAPDNDNCDENYLLTWSDSDFDDNATIYLYYDADDAGYDGVCLNPGAPLYEDDEDSYLWDTSQMPEGTFWVYGVISDGVNQNQDYSPGWLAVAHTNDPPAINMTSPNYEVCDQSFTITWEDADPDDNALIYLFYDVSYLGYDGICINPADPIYEDDPDSYVWDLSQVPAGMYWLYGTITDGENQDQHYGPGWLTIEHGGGAVGDLAISLDGDDVLLEWSAVAGAAGYNIYRLPEPHALPGTLAGNTTSTTFTLVDELLSHASAFYIVTVVY